MRKEILKTGHPFGVFTLVELDDEYYLIDGQHRQVALSRAIKKEPELVDCPIIVMSFRVESDVEAVELFRKVNNTRPLEPRDTPNTIIVTVIDKLSKHFKRAIKKDQTRTCYPYIVADELHKKLREIELEGVTPEKLYKAILALNSEYRKKASADGIRAIPGIRGAQTLKKQSVEKAKQSGFYLGLDEKWFWLQDLEEML